MHSFSFDGTAREYFKIWIVNILLTIVTLTIYYPWAKVRTNRYIYANSKLDGRNFEYHATGKQLLPGHLIAVVLLLAYVILQQLSPVVAGVMLILFFLALPWIIWRSLRFNMRVTSFSNVRLGFTGTAGRAYLNYLIYPVALLIGVGVLTFLIGLPLRAFDIAPSSTVGAAIGLFTLVAAFGYAIWAYAFLKHRNSCYQFNGMRYGQGAVRTDINVRPLMLYILGGLAVGLGGLLLFLVVAGLLANALGLMGQYMQTVAVIQQNPQMLQFMLPGLIVPIIAGYLALLFLFYLAKAFTFTRQRTYILANTKLDEKISFASTLSARQYAWVTLTNLLAIAVPVIVAVGAPSTLFFLMGGGILGGVISAVVFLGAMYLAGLAYCWGKMRMARLVLTNTQADVSQGFDEYMTQKQKEESALGDQIGDAFDVDIGIGV